MAKHYIRNAVGVAVGLYAFNKLIDIHAQVLSNRNLLAGEIYNHRTGDIYYRVVGEGSPVLLIHNLDPGRASFEWKSVAADLSTNHKVYVVDLPGCGRSTKMRSGYTAFFYSQFLKDFLTEVIGEPATVVASRHSANFAVMAAGMDPDLFKNLILLNPDPIIEDESSVSAVKTLYSRALLAPIVGTTLYNLTNFEFRTINPKKFFKKGIGEHTLEIIENEYINAHLGGSNGKYLRSSIVNKATEGDITNHLKNIKKISLLVSRDLPAASRISLTYKSYLPDIRVGTISTASKDPQITAPDKVINAIKEMIG